MMELLDLPRLGSDGEVKGAHSSSTMNELDRGRETYLKGLQRDDRLTMRV